MKLPKELDHPRKGWINIQNINANKCLKWCADRYLHPAEHHPVRIRKTGEILADQLDFEDISFPIKIKYCHKIEKKNSTGIIVFGYETTEKHST